MKISNKITKFQEGGAMADPAAAAPAPEGGGAQAAPEQDPVMQLAQVAQQALQSSDCEAALAVCEGLLGLLQGAEGGAAPEEQGAPVYRKGGKLVRRVKR